MNRWTEGMRWAALAGAALLVSGGCARQDDAAGSATATQLAAGHPECPARDDSIIVFDSMRVRHAFGQSQLAGPTHNTPEYHDCQKLLAGTSDAYGPLVGVWAAYPLAARFDSLAGGDTVAVAELFNWGGPYPMLGIERYFNCLYLRRTGDTLVAEMVPVGLDDTGCLQSRSHLRPGTTLHVARQPLREDPPPVARWEWSRTGTQYIGIACGTGWCRVGPAGFQPDSVHLASELADVRQVPGSAPGARLRVAGWYDEQRLAPPAGAPTTATEMRAIIVPDERLGQYGYSDFEGRWARVAFVRFETGSGAAPNTHAARLEYGNKFGFATGDTTSVLWLCRGLGECPGLRRALGDSLLERLPAAYRGPRPVSQQEIANGASPTVPNLWWARITVGSGKPTYRPVIRCDHSAEGIPVPGTARWRWTLDDETVWVRCVNGCCEVKGAN
jgi:hypothetical protein